MKKVISSQELEQELKEEAIKYFKYKLKQRIGQLNRLKDKHELQLKDAYRSIEEIEEMSIQDMIKEYSIYLSECSDYGR